MSSTKFMWFSDHLSRRLKWAIVTAGRLNGIQENLIGSKVSKSSTKFVFFGSIRKKQDSRSGIWLADTFSTSPLKQLDGIQRNLIGSRTSTFVFFGPIGKTRWPPWPLACWGIFDFSETAKRNSMKLDRKQDLNVLYQDRKNKMAALASD